MEVGGEVWRDVVWCYVWAGAECAAVGGRLGFMEGEGVEIVVGGEREGE